MALRLQRSLHLSLSLSLCAVAVRLSACHCHTRLAGDATTPLLVVSSSNSTCHGRQARGALEHHSELLSRLLQCQSKLALVSLALAKFLQQCTQLLALFTLCCVCVCGSAQLPSEKAARERDGRRLAAAVMVVALSLRDRACVRHRARQRERLIEQALVEGHFQRCILASYCCHGGD